MNDKVVLSDGSIIQRIVWQLQEPTSERPHGLKYRLYCGKEGRSIVRYDNEAGKGDHVHYGEKHECSYHFVSLERLILDFYADIERLTGELR